MIVCPHNGIRKSLRNAHDCLNASRSWKPGTLSYGNGCTYKMPVGNAEEMAKLDASYEHLCKMRDELVTLNIVPPISEWNKINPNL